MICRGGERLAVMCGVKKKCKEEAVNNINENS